MILNQYFAFDIACIFKETMPFHVHDLKFKKPEFTPEEKQMDVESKPTKLGLQNVKHDVSTLSLFALPCGILPISILSNIFLLIYQMFNETNLNKTYHSTTI